MATNEAWLALAREEALEPELPICDPHHHFWRDRKGTVEPLYLLDELMADIRLGHNIVSTVFIECGAEFRADGPRDMAPLGETAFVREIADIITLMHLGSTLSEGPMSVVENDPKVKEVYLGSEGISDAA